MATVSPENIDLDGLDATYNAASGGGDKITQPGDNLAIHVKNDSGASINVTITTPGTVAGHAVEDRVVAVPAGEDRFIGPLRSAVFANSDEQIDIAWSATTSVTFAVLKL